MQHNKYIVQYTLCDEHRVTFGIDDKNLENTIARANTLFDQGKICDNTKEIPLILDIFEETEDAGLPLVFTKTLH